ncbi:hypothetical protein H5410_032304 [Solanum commersonii]|uniref:Uncharacterized protein n=1 Tax=Solanum commersonii TaxID=4109 RepID=A0A9J5YPY9_SOLCO|nr:hypothetical protein H5410_032304 [Solanum commersonii]
MQRRQEFNTVSSRYQYSRLNQVHLEEEGQVVGITELEIVNRSEKQSKARPVKDRTKTEDYLTKYR